MLPRMIEEDKVVYSRGFEGQNESNEEKLKMMIDVVWLFYGKGPKQWEKKDHPPPAATSPAGNRTPPPEKEKETRKKREQWEML